MQNNFASTKIMLEVGSLLATIPSSQQQDMTEKSLRVCSHTQTERDVFNRRDLLLSKQDRREGCCREVLTAAGLETVTSTVSSWNMRG